MFGKLGRRRQLGNIVNSAIDGLAPVPRADYGGRDFTHPAFA
jgi:hypothetical protein